MALNNYGPRGLLDTAPWSPAGLQAGSGLNRYTNMQPGGMPAPMRPDPVQMQQYAPPAMRSLADSLAQYKAQAAAAAAPPPLVGTPGVLPSEQIWQGSGGSSVDHSGVGGGGTSGADGGAGDGAGGFDLGSFDLGSFASAIGADTAMSGARLGSLFGPIGTLAGGLLGYYTQQGNESARVANNNADMNTRAGLSNAEVSATPGLGGMGVSIGPGLGATLDGGFAGGQGFDVPTLGSSLAPAEAAPSPAPAPQQTPVYTPVIYDGSYNPYTGEVEVSGNFGIGYGGDPAGGYGGDGYSGNFGIGYGGDPAGGYGGAEGFGGGLGWGGAGNAGYGFGGLGGGDGWSDGGGWANGGVVTADRLHGPDPAGPDDGYGALKSGEFVLTAEAARVIGYDKLAELNKLGRTGKKGLL